MSQRGVATPEERLALFAASTHSRQREVRDRIERLASQVDWGSFTELLRARRLLPTLGPRAAALPGVCPPERFLEAVDESLLASRRQAALLALIGERVQRALEGVGIRCAALKGPKLSEAIYGDPGRRLASDIDLLVERSRLKQAVAVVREFGYGPPLDHVDRRGLPSLHFALAHVRGELPPVELHWRVHCLEERFAESRLLPPARTDAGDWRPAPADEVAALMLFYARDGFMSLKLAADLGAWWDAFAGRLDCYPLDDTVYSFPELRYALTAAAAVAEATIGVPAERLTRASGRLGRRGRLAVRLATPHPRMSDPQLYAQMGLIEGLLLPRGGLPPFLRRQVVPPRQVLRAHAQISSRGWPRSRLGHGLRILGRYGLAVARAFRTPADVHCR